MKSKSLLVVSHGKYIPPRDTQIVYSAWEVDVKRVDAIKALLSGHRGEDYKISMRKRDIVVKIHGVAGHWRMPIDDFNEI